MKRNDVNHFLTTVFTIVLFGCLLSACEIYEATQHSNKGNEYFDQGKLEDAISSYQKVIQLDSNVAPAYFGLGYVYQQFEDAITAYQ